MRRNSDPIVGYVLAALSVATWIGQRLFAAGPAPVPAPEIDGGSISAGLGLLAAAVLIVRSPRK